MFRKAGLFALGGLLLSNTLAEGQQTYAVRPGDEVTIAFFTAAGEELDEVAGTRIVDAGGEIFLPYVGTVRVSGLDATGIRELLVERYSSIYSNPVVDVTVRLRVNVLGAVRQPGLFFVDPTSTVIDAIATASGFTSEVEYGGVGAGASDPSQVRLVRGRETQVLDLRPTSANPDHYTIQIQSGDWLYVPTQARSSLRDDINFYGSVASLILSIASVILLFGK